MISMGKGNNWLTKYWLKAILISSDGKNEQDSILAWTYVSLWNVGGQGVNDDNVSKVLNWYNNSYFSGL